MKTASIALSDGEVFTFEVADNEEVPTYAVEVAVTVESQVKFLTSVLNEEPDEYEISLGEWYLNVREMLLKKYRDELEDIEGFNKDEFINHAIELVTDSLEKAETYANNLADSGNGSIHTKVLEVTTD